MTALIKALEGADGPSLIDRLEMANSIIGGYSYISADEKIDFLIGETIREAITALRAHKTEV